MTLAELLERVEHTVLSGPVDRTVTALTQDSRMGGPGVVFVALKGQRADGHDYAAQVQAQAVVVQRPVQVQAGATQIQVPDTQRALAQLAAAFHGHPSQALSLVGITGTNGKTTITWMLEAIAQAANQPIGVIGTTGNRIDGQVVPAGFTTPLAPEWQGLLSQMRNAGCAWVAAEVSSIGLAAHRVDHTRFSVGVYTNLSQDHLDFHGSMLAYQDAKARLFTELLDPQGIAVLCGEDSAASQVEFSGKRWLYGIQTGDLHCTDLQMDHLGSRGRVHTPKGSFDLNLKLVGRFNVLNALGAAGAALALGALPAQVGAGLAALPAVPGRLEAVPNTQGFGVLVDYAHTPDALDSVLAALRELHPKRLICVVGCGGDRDRSKRLLMAQAAARGSDWVIATSDNPRSEAPEAILAEMKPGLRSQDEVIVDRGQAIAQAIRAAQPGDLVLIAGKGHERNQEIGGKKVPFDDRVVAKAALESRA